MSACQCSWILSMIWLFVSHFLVQQIGRSPICIVRPVSPNTVARARDKEAPLRLAAVGGKGDSPTRSHVECGRGNVRMGDDWHYSHSTRNQQTGLNSSKGHHRGTHRGGDSPPTDGDQMGTMCHISSRSGRRGGSQCSRSSARVLLFPPHCQGGSGASAGASLGGRDVSAGAWGVDGQIGAGHAAAVPAIAGVGSDRTPCERGSRRARDCGNGANASRRCVSEGEGGEGDRGSADERLSTAIGATTRVCRLTHDGQAGACTPAGGEGKERAVALCDCNEGMEATNEAGMREGDVVEMLIGQVAYRLQFTSAGGGVDCGEEEGGGFSSLFFRAGRKEVEVERSNEVRRFFFRRRRRRLFPSIFLSPVSALRASPLFPVRARGERHTGSSQRYEFPRTSLYLARAAIAFFFSARRQLSNAFRSMPLPTLNIQSFCFF